MEQIPQDTAKQILQNRQQYQSDINTLSNPLTYNVSQLISGSMGGGQVLQQQQRAAAEIQRQQVLQQTQAASNEFEKSAQQYQQQIAAQQATISASSKEADDWVTAQKLIDKNKEYAAAGDPSVISKIRYIKAHGGQGLAQATATSMIRQGFTPEAITTTLKNTTYAGKSLGEYVGMKSEPVKQIDIPTEKIYIAGTGWVESLKKTYVPTDVFNTFVSRIEQGRQAEITLINLGSKARDQPVEQIQELQKKITEGRETLKAVKDYNILPEQKRIITTPETKSIFATLSSYEQWKIAPTTLPFKEWAKQQGIDVSKVTTEAGGIGSGGGGGRAGQIEFSKGSFGGGGASMTGDTINLLGSKTINVNMPSAAYILKDGKLIYSEEPYTQLDSKYFGGFLPGGNSPSQVKIIKQSYKQDLTNKEIDINGIKDIAIEYGVKPLRFGFRFALSPLESYQNIPLPEKTRADIAWRRWLTKSEMGIAPSSTDTNPLKIITGGRYAGAEATVKGVTNFFKDRSEGFNIITAGESAKAIGKSYETKATTALFEREIIDKNLEGYSDTVDKINVVAEKQKELNKQIEEYQKQIDASTKTINEKAFDVKNAEFMFKQGSISYDAYKKVYDAYNNYYADYTKIKDSVDLKFKDYKSQSEANTKEVDKLMLNPNYKAIDDLQKERGPLGTFSEDLAKTNLTPLQKVVVSAIPPAAETFTWLIPAGRVLKGGELATTGIYDISKEKYFQGAAEIAGGSLALFGPTIIKAVAPTKFGKAVGNIFKTPLSSYGIGGTIPAAYEGLGAAGATTIGVRLGGVTVGKAVGYGLYYPFISAAGLAKGVETYQASKGDIYQAIGSGIGMSGSLLAVPWILKQRQVIGDKEIIPAPDKTFKDGLAEKGATIPKDEKIVRFVNGRRQEIEEPFKLIVTGEETTPGVTSGPRYVRLQKTIQNLYSKFGIPYTPAPIYPGTRGEALVSGVGFGAGEDLSYSAAKSEKGYKVILNLLQEQGLTLAQAKDALKMIPAKDILTITESEGSKLITTYKTKGAEIPRISTTVGVTGTQNAYELKSQSTFQSSLTGKPITFFRSGLELGPLTASEKASSADIVMALQSRVSKQLKDVGNIYTLAPRTVSTNIPFVRQALNAPSQYQVKSADEVKIDYQSLAQRKEAEKTGATPRDWLGLKETGGQKGKATVSGETIRVQKNQEITDLYDEENRLVARRVVTIEQPTLPKKEVIISDGKKESAIKIYNPKDYPGKITSTVTYNTENPTGRFLETHPLKDVDIDNWAQGNRITYMEVKQTGISSLPYTVPKEARGQPLVIDQTQAKTLSIGELDTTQKFKEPTSVIKVEYLRTDPKARLVLDYPGTGQRITIKPNIQIGVGREFYGDTNAFMYDPKTGDLAVDLSGRTPGRIYDASRYVKPESLANVPNLQNILETRGKVNIDLQTKVPGQFNKFTIIKDAVSGEISVIPRNINSIDEAVPRLVLKEGQLPITVSRISKGEGFGWLADKTEPTVNTIGSQIKKDFIKVENIKPKGLPESQEVISKIFNQDNVGISLKDKGGYSPTVEEILSKIRTPEERLKIIEEAFRDVKKIPDVTKASGIPLKDKGGYLGRTNTMLNKYAELETPKITDFTTDRYSKISDVVKQLESKGFNVDYIQGVNSDLTFPPVNKKINIGPGSTGRFIYNTLTSPIPVTYTSYGGESLSLPGTVSGTGNVIVPIPEINLDTGYSPASIVRPSNVLTPVSSPYIEVIPRPIIDIIPVITPVPSPVSNPVVNPVPIVNPVVTPVVTPVITPVITPVPVPVPAPTPVIQAPYQTPLPRIAWAPISIPTKQEQKKKKPEKKKGEGFEVEIRRRRKFQEAAPFAFATKEEAISFGAQKTVQEAAATFRVRSSKKPIKQTVTSPFPVGQYFRPPKRTEADTYVQISTKRITTPGEKREISYRGAMARKGVQSAMSGRSSSFSKTSSSLSPKNKSTNFLKSKTTKSKSKGIFKIK